MDEEIKWTATARAYIDDDEPTRDMNKCPFCGSEGMAEEHKMLIIPWPGVDSEIYGRMPKCYETEISDLKKRLAVLDEAFSNGELMWCIGDDETSRAYDKLKEMEDI